MLQRLVASEVTGSLPVEIFRTAFGFAIRYGLQVESGLSLDDALAKHADMLRHSLEGAGIYEEADS
jgi:hypothetical protein